MKYLIGGVITMIITSLLLMIIIPFTMVPLIYEKSFDLQLKSVFPTPYLLPANPEFDNFIKYGIQGVKNFHVVVNRSNYVVLGVWHLLPHSLVNESIQNRNFDFIKTLARSDYPVILHFHSSGGNRIKFINMYSVLRIFFHVFAFDYRGYGDSSDVVPSEEAIVQDSIQLYKWVRIRTHADIYLWGHSLGAALSTHTIARLKAENIVPMGLFLEAPFTSMRDQIQRDSFHKIFSWLPWYESTMLNPLEKNGFVFNTTKHIAMVDCPIMIIHAEDDGVTPYYFGERLYKIAKENRGNATFYLLPERLHCGHFSIRKAPELPSYIWNHIMTCWIYNKRTRPPRESPDTKESLEIYHSV